MEAENYLDMHNFSGTSFLLICVKQLSYSISDQSPRNIQLSWTKRLPHPWQRCWRAGVHQTQREPPFLKILQIVPFIRFRLFSRPNFARAAIFTLHCIRCHFTDFTCTFFHLDLSSFMINLILIKTLWQTGHFSRFTRSRLQYVGFHKRATKPIFTPARF